MFLGSLLIQFNIDPGYLLDYLVFNFSVFVVNAKGILMSPYFLTGYVSLFSLYESNSFFAFNNFSICYFTKFLVLLILIFLLNFPI